MLSDLVRKDILKVVPYVAGKPIEEARREFRLKEVIKLASNENPLGPSPKAKEAMKKYFSQVNRYPDSNGFYLKKKIAQSLRVNAANIVLGNGSDELIDVLIKTFVEADENILTADTTFVEYEIISQINGRKVTSVPLRYFKYDLEAIKERIDNKTKLIFIANPNNPTGTYVSKDELEYFLKDLPKNVIVVLDEAYDLFIDVQDFPYSLNYLKNKNVVILKTFSKAYGLAGLRIGYAVVPEEFSYYLERVRQPFNVNLLAQIAAIAALDDKGFLRKTKKLILEQKEYLYRSLSAMGIAYLPSVANFILMDVGKDAAEVFRKMLKYGVIVRDMRQYGLNNFIRVTIGTKKENGKFIKVLKKIL